MEAGGLVIGVEVLGVLWEVHFEMPHHEVARKVEPMGGFWMINALICEVFWKFGRMRAFW